MRRENFRLIFGEVSPKKIEDLERKIDEMGLDLSQIDEKFVKGSGKGGQKRNKTNNAVVLKHLPTGITSRCAKTRSLSVNRFIALRNLIEKLSELGFYHRRLNMKILDGKAVAQQINEETISICERFFKKTGRKPSLAIVNYYKDSPSSYYMNLKVKKSSSLGIEAKVYMPDERSGKNYFLNLIKDLGRDRNVDAIMVERPLPAGFDDKDFWDLLDPSKDVDGLSSINMGRLFITREISDIRNGLFFVPQTAYACLKILDYYGIDPSGKRACVIGRSSVVGKPLAIMLSLMNATVTLCHSKTENLSWHLKNSDIIFVAIGKPRFIKGDMIGEDQIIIDIGTNIDENGKIVGDVDFESVKDKVALITPVPGGVGAVTLACLLNATARAAQNGII